MLRDSQDCSKVTVAIENVNFLVSERHKFLHFSICSYFSRQKTLKLWLGTELFDFGNRSPRNMCFGLTQYLNRTNLQLTCI